MNESFLIRRNAEPAPLAQVPLVSAAAFRSAILDAVAAGSPVLDAALAPLGTAGGMQALIPPGVPDGTQPATYAPTLLAASPK